jgi:biotin operon repressor
MRRTANDINGEVLLALSTENLKSEIGIESFGTRTTIMKAIKELRSEGECVVCRAECS